MLFDDILGIQDENVNCIIKNQMQQTTIRYFSQGYNEHDEGNRIYLGIRPLEWA